MEVREYRIGNLLFFPFTNEVVEILGINAYETNKGIEYSLSFKRDFNLYCEKITLLKPIPLTKEWFKKFGYYDTNMPNHFIKNEMTIDEHRFWVCNEMFIDDKNGVRIKYVHQLQNLYFALRQKELTIINKE